MESKKSVWTGIFSGFGMLILILDGKTALFGAREGIELCLRTVIPSLFPFFVLSPLLTGSLSGRRLPLLRPIGRLCGIPEGGESFLLVGLLGGYPIGARGIHAAFTSHRLSRGDAKRMLGFCSNAGPAFVFGIAGSLFSSPRAAFLLWAIHVISALCVGFLLPGKSRGRICLSQVPKPSAAQTLKGAAAGMAEVCGWVVVFRVALAFLDRWFLWMLPQPVRVGIMGILELSNGCVALKEIPEEGLRFVLCSGFLALGGLCVGMQTVSVTDCLGTGLYFPGKLMQCILSLFLSSIAQIFLFSPGMRWTVSPLVPALFLVAGLTSAIFLPKKEKTVAILGK